MNVARASWSRVGGVTPVTMMTRSASSSSPAGGTIQASRSAGASVLLVVPTNATRSGARPCMDATGSRPNRYSTSSRLGGSNEPGPSRPDRIATRRTSSSWRRSGIPGSNETSRSMSQKLL